jgi:hypothetical protein
MIVYECIEIHPRSCGGWIIIMRFKILLITYYLIWEMLVEAILDVHTRGVRKKKLSIQML